MHTSSSGTWVWNCSGHTSCSTHWYRREQWTAFYSWYKGREPEKLWTDCWSRVCSGCCLICRWVNDTWMLYFKPKFIFLTSLSHTLHVPVVNWITETKFYHHVLFSKKYAYKRHKRNFCGKKCSKDENLMNLMLFNLTDKSYINKIYCLLYFFMINWFKIHIGHNIHVHTLKFIILKCHNTTPNFFVFDTTEDFFDLR